MITVEIKDIYQVAYLLMKGGFIQSARERYVAENRREKLGYVSQWYITVETKQQDLDDWNNSNEGRLIQEYRDARKRAKRVVKKLLVKSNFYED